MCISVEGLGVYCKSMKELGLYCESVEKMVSDAEYTVYIGAIFYCKKYERTILIAQLSVRRVCLSRQT